MRQSLKGSLGFKVFFKSFIEKFPERKILLLLLIIFLIRGVLYGTLIPAGNAPDEPEHFIGTQLTAEKYFPEVKKEIIGEWHKGKLYNYWALLGYLPFRNFSIVERFYIMRLFSIPLGLGVILFSFLIAKELFPKNNFVKFGTPIFVAFVPQFTHISSVINPDNLVNFLFAIFLFFSVIILVKGFNVWRVLALLGAAILALLTKRTAFISLPLILFLFVLYLFRKRSTNILTFFLKVGSIISLLFLTKFYFFSLLNFFSAKFPLGIRAEIVIKKIVNSRLAFLSYMSSYFDFPPRFPLFTSFWAEFSWLNVPIGTGFYQSLYLLTWFAWGGLLVFLLTEGIKVFFQNPQDEQARQRFLAVVFLLLAVACAFLQIMVATFYGGTGPGQGRWSYVALAGIAVLFTVGLSTPFKPNHYLKLLLVLFVFLFLIDFSSLIFYIIPRYYFYSSKYVFGPIFDFARPKGLFFGSHLYPDAVKELSRRPFPLNRSEFFICLFVIYLIVIVLFILNLSRNKIWQEEK